MGWIYEGSKGYYSFRYILWTKIILNNSFPTNLKNRTKNLWCFSLSSRIYYFIILNWDIVSNGNWTGMEKKKKKNLLIFIDCFDNSFRNFPTNSREKNIKLVIFFYTRPTQNLSISISIRSQVSTFFFFFFLITCSNLLRDIHIYIYVYVIKRDTSEMYSINSHIYILPSRYNVHACY